MGRMPGVLAGLLISALPGSAQQPSAPPPDTEIVLASLSPDSRVVVGSPLNITNSPGYDNQPAFTPDGAGILFASIRGGAQTDIYRYDVASAATTRVTSTPESEYSPTVTPDGGHISVIRVEADGTQRLWRFTIDGRKPELVLANIKPVGYHAWADDHTLALFVLGSPATLQLADTSTGTADVLVAGINRSIQRIPGRGRISFVVRRPVDANGGAALSIRELNPKTKRVTPLVDAVAGAREADCAWTPDGMLVMVEQDVLYGWRAGQAGWRRLADLAALGLHGVTRIAINPKGDRIALVTQPLVAPAAGQSRTETDINVRIRQEANSHSQIMKTLHVLTDVYGPRVTGSPSLKAAGEWAIRQMQSWGFTNGHLEPWDFGHPGWVNERFSAHITAPVKDQLTCEVVAWTPGTDGTVTARAYQLQMPDRPTPAQLASFLESEKLKVKDRIVLVGRHTLVPVIITPPARRRTDDEVRAQYDPDNPNGGRGGRGGRGDQPAPPMTARQIDEQIDAFLVAHGATLRVNDAAREHGQIIAFNNRTYDVAKAVPTVVMRNEDYGRIARILADGTPVELEFNIVNTVDPEGRTAYNTIAEIPGTDKKEEVVMLGGHLDSWHAATGATDNAIGCATMMEAARILKAIGVTPRRTIRVALWSGEEEGLLGSQAYVKEHFGSFEHQKQPEYATLVAYLNIDSGTGRARGAGVFGPPSAAAVVRQALAPFMDLGVAGATATTSRAIAGTDSTSFNNVGLPGIGFGQDPIEYNTHTHHTNLDTYERVIEEDVKASAIAIAATLYQLVMRDEMLPRLTSAQMPPLPARP